MDDLADFGPAMRALNERQRGFVLALRGQRKTNITAAARLAGYKADSYGYLRRQAHRVMHTPAVIEALQEEARKHLDGSALAMASLLTSIALDPKQEPKERRAAAVAVLDRIPSFGPSQNINVHKTVTDLTGAAMVGRIRELAAVLGVDAGKLLGANAEVSREQLPVVIEGEVVDAEK